MAYRDFEEGRSGTVGPFNSKTGEALKDWEAGNRIRIAEEYQRTRQQEKVRAEKGIRDEREAEDSAIRRQIEEAEEDLKYLLEFGIRRGGEESKLPEASSERYLEFFERTSGWLWFFVGISVILLFQPPSNGSKFIIVSTFIILFFWVIIFLISSRAQHPTPEGALKGFSWSYCAISGCKCRNPKICLGKKCDCGWPKACDGGKTCDCGLPKVCTDPKCDCARRKVATTRFTKLI